MNRNLLIAGDGQCARIAKETAEAMGIYEKIDLLSNQAEDAVGRTADMEKYALEYQYAISADDQPEVRIRLHESLRMNGYTVTALVHPKAYVSDGAQISPGCIIEPMAVVKDGCVLNPCVIVSAGAIIDSGCLICEGCCLEPGSIIKSGSVMPAGRKLETGEIFEGISMKVGVRMPETGIFPAEKPC